MNSVKKNDSVKVLVGKDRGKTGKVLNVNLGNFTATVEGVNIAVRHERPKKQGQKGQKIEVPMPVRISNLMLVCKACKKPSRTRREIDEKGKKQRICINCGKKA